MSLRKRVAGDTLASPFVLTTWKVDVLKLDNRRFTPQPENDCDDSERNCSWASSRIGSAYPLLRSFFSTNETTLFTDPKLSVVTSSSSTAMVKRS